MICWPNAEVRQSFAQAEPLANAGAYMPAPLDLAPQINSKCNSHDTVYDDDGDEHAAGMVLAACAMTTATDVGIHDSVSDIRADCEFNLHAPLHKCYMSRFLE